MSSRNLRSRAASRNHFSTSPLPRELRLLKEDRVSVKPPSGRRQRKLVQRLVATAPTPSCEYRELPGRQVSRRNEAIRVAHKGRNGFECCKEILTALIHTHHHESWPFHHPVDESIAADYYSVIKKPMDLLTVRTKLKGEKYGCMMDFVRDIRLMATNCFKYNPPDHPVVSLGKTLLEIFESYLVEVPGIFLNTDGAFFLTDPNDPDLQAAIPRRSRKLQPVTPTVDQNGNDGNLQAERVICLENIKTQLRHVKAKLSDILEDHDSETRKITTSTRKRGRPRKEIVTGLPFHSRDSSGATPVSASEKNLPQGSSRSSCLRSVSGDTESFELSSSQVERMCAEVAKLGPDKLLMVADIVKRCEPPELWESGPDAMSIDFALLKESTVREIRSFLTESAENHGAVIPISGMKRGRGRPRMGEKYVPVPPMVEQDQDSGAFSVSESSDDGTDDDDMH